MTRIAPILLGVAAAFQLACAHAHPRGTYALVSKDVVPFQYRMVRAESVVAQNCTGLGAIVFGLPPARDMYVKAARAAIEHVPGANALIRVKFAVLRWQGCVRVEGYPVTLR